MKLGGPLGWETNAIADTALDQLRFSLPLYKGLTKKHSLIFFVVATRGLNYKIRMDLIQNHYMHLIMAKPAHLNLTNPKLNSPILWPDVLSFLNKFMNLSNETLVNACVCVCIVGMIPECSIYDICIICISCMYVYMGLYGCMRLCLCWPTTSKDQLTNVSMGTMTLLQTFDGSTFLTTHGQRC